MLTRLSEQLGKYAKGWLVLILFLLDGLFMGMVLPGIEARLKSVSNGTGPIDLQFFYTPDKVYNMIASYGEAGRASYRNVEMTLDIIYPIVYTLFFSLLITWLFKRGFSAESKMHRLNVVPFGTWFFDLLENLGMVAMLSVYPSTPALLAWISSIFTMIKWAFAIASMALVLVGVIAAIRKAFIRDRLPAVAK